MRGVRTWLVAAFVFFLAVGLADQLWQPLAMVVFVIPVVVLVGLVVLLTSIIETVSTAWLALLVLPVAAVAKLTLGGPGTEAPLIPTLFELFSIGIGLFIVCELGRSLRFIERTVRDFAIPELSNSPLSFDASQGRLYQELRRARRYRRHLSVMALAVDPDTMAEEAVDDSLLMEMQRTNVVRFANAQVGTLLLEETNGCQIVTRRNGHFLVLLPETDPEGMAALSRRLEEEAQSRLGLRIRVGSASFPRDEVTLKRLVETAEAQMSVSGAPRIRELERVRRRSLSDASLNR